MNSIDTTAADLLELAGCLSDEPLNSLFDNNALEPLVMLLFSPEIDADYDIDDTYRVTIARYLIYAGEEMIDHLITFLVELPYFSLYDWRQNIRVDIADLMGTHGDAAIAPAVLGFFDKQTDLNQPVMKAVARAAIQLDPDNSIEALVERMLYQELRSMRRWMVEVLGESSHPATIMPLILMLQDPAPDVVQAAIEALSLTCSPSAFPFLVEALFDNRLVEVRYNQNVYVAVHAAQAIYKYQTPQSNRVVFDWCISSLESEEFNVVFIASRLLWKLQDKRALPYIEKAMQSEHIQNDGEWRTIRRRLRDMLYYMSPPDIESP